MSFVNAGLVGFAVLASIPILIHLLHRPRPKALPFPSLLFLQQCTRRSRAIHKLRHFLLMLLRALAVAGIALAVARPRIAGAAQADEGGIAAALVVDDSFRLAYRDGGLSRFDEARDRALNVLATVPPGTPCTLVMASGESSALLPDPTPLRAELMRTRVSDLSSPLLPAIVEACRLLEEAGGRRREIHVFTDLARCAWTGAAANALAPLADATVYVHDVGRDKPSNLAVTRLDVSPRSPQSGRPIEVAATVAGWGTSGPVSVVLERGDGRREERLVSVPDGGTAIARFQFVPESASVAHGVVRIQTPDPLAPDNERGYAIPVNAPLRLLALEPGAMPPYVSFALAPPTLSQRRPTEVTVADRAIDAKGFDGVFITDPSALAQEEVHRLAGWVQQGGGMVVFACSSATAMNALGAAGLAPACGAEKEVAPPQHPSPSSIDHPALAGFKAGRNGDLSAPEITRRLAVKPDARWRVALRTLDGEPAVCEAALGRGRVVFFAFSLNGWTDLPKLPCFVPMLHELARHLSRAAGAERDVLVGTPVVLELRQRLVESSFTLTSLGTGERESRRAEPGTYTLPVAAALKPGRWSVEFRAEDGPQVRPFAVNLDTSASDPTRLEPEAVAKLLPQSRVLFTYDRAGAAAVRSQRTGAEFTTVILLLIVVILLFEVWLSSRL